MTSNYFENQEIENALNSHQKGNLREAENIYKDVIQKNPKNSLALTLYATLLLQQDKDDKAIDYFEKSILIDPSQAMSYCNLGVSLFKRKEYQNALKNYDHAIKLKPDYFEAYRFKGITLKALKKLQEALECFKKAIEINPTFSSAFIDLADLLFKRHLYEDALKVYDRLSYLMPNCSDAYIYKGIILHSQKRYKDQLDNYNKAISLGLSPNFLLGAKLHTLMYLNQWNELHQLVQDIITKINLNVPVSVPFNLLAIIDDPNLLKKSAEHVTKTNYPINDYLGNFEQFQKNKKIRVGFFSSDFYDHATMHLLGDMLQCLDKSQFEYIGISFGPKTDDEWYRIAQTSFDHFIQIDTETDEEIAELSRGMKIDIALDLKGYTGGNRTSIFSYRAAPIQVNFLGFPATMGAEYIDYIIADKIVIPEDKKIFYTEKVVYLLNCYQPNCKVRKISSKAFTKKEFGLPSKGFIFCCFNSNYKITPDIFDIWMNILKEVKDSVLWLYRTNEEAVQNLLKEAEIRGINRNRLIFATHLPVDEHLKRITYADLFLDTFPCNAHTTASDSLRMGVPLLTLMGNSFASRVAGSLLNTLNMEELITNSKEEYLKLAIKLASNPLELQKIKSKLVDNIKISPLFDPKIYTKNLEAIFKEIYFNL